MLFDLVNRCMTETGPGSRRKKEIFAIKKDILRRHLPPLLDPVPLVVVEWADWQHP